jgi:hypothetical protein
LLAVTDTIVRRYKIRVEHLRWEKTEDGRGYKRVSLPTTEELVEVQINVGLIAEEIGSRAVKNVNGRAFQAGGLIKVEHVRPKKPRRKKDAGQDAGGAGSDADTVQGRG